MRYMANENDKRLPLAGAVHRRFMSRKCAHRMEMSKLRSLISTYVTGRDTHADYELLNKAQLRVQVLTLPEDTAFCSECGATGRAEAALAMCGGDARRLLGREYNAIRKAAHRRYERAAN